MQRPSWQAQISGSKTWHLLPPPECEKECTAINITVQKGDISTSKDLLQLLCLFTLNFNNLTRLKLNIYLIPQQNVTYVIFTQSFLTN